MAGSVQRYWIQNTNFQSFADITGAFFHHLLQRGYTTKTLAPIFEEVASKLDRKSQPSALQRLANRDTLAPPPTEPRLFFHWEQHPRGIPRKAIRQLYHTHLAPVLAQPPLNISQFTIAMHNPPNLRRILTKTQMNEEPGSNASSLIGRLKKQLTTPAAP